MTPTLKKKIWTAARLLLGLALLAAALFGVNWAKVLEQFAAVHPFFLLMALGLVLAGLFLKIMRWQVLLRLVGVRLPYRSALAAFFLGQAANIILPVRGGEAVRLGAALPAAPGRLPELVASIFLEKYLDLVALAVSALIALATVSGSLTGFNPAGVIATTGLLTLFLVLFVWIGPWLWRRMRELPILARFRRFTGWVDRLLDSLQWLRSPARALPLLLFTALVWGIMALTNYVLFFSLDIPANPAAALVVLIMIYIGVLPALMPGNFGPFLFFAQLALQSYRVPPENALAYAIILHALVTLPPLILGGVSMLAAPNKNQPDPSNQP
jgi:glycosyltransferase 2 family protein